MMKRKITIDILLTILLMILMLGQYTGVLIHEILGICIIILFIAHHVLNKEYYKNIFKGKYNKLRVIYLIIDTLMFIMLFLMIISTFMISRKLLVFMGLSNEYYGRILHVISGYSLYILCGIHLGLHYNRMIKLKKESKTILNIFMVLIAFIFGISAFLKRKIISKLTLEIMYPIYSEDSIIISFIDYLSMFILFMMIGYAIFNIIKIKKKKES